MQRDADGDQFFGFCGVRVYVPDDDPLAESNADGVLRRFRERLADKLAKDKLVAGHEPANPHNKPVDELPVIFGFNNGGSPGWLSAVLIAEDGKVLGEHCCSHEGYMPHDLGILEGTRPDRHETFREHYPDGYRMQFVGYNDIKDCAPLNAALEKFEKHDTTKGEPS